jgi:RNA polymerase sigma factor (sigma-70 family)
MLLPRIAVGDSSAVTSCIEEYGNLIWSTARRWSANAPDAEDAVQEIFIDLWKSAGRFDPTVSSETTFVMMIARRRLIDRRRRKQVGTEPLDFSDQSGCVDRHSDPQATAELEEESAIAREFLGELKEDERRVLELSVNDGLSHQEIAKRVGMPLGSVKTNIRRGLGRLRDRLSRCGLSAATRDVL